MTASPAADQPLATLELPIEGMDCAKCAREIRQALEAVPGVQFADVFFSSEKAIIRHDPTRADLPAIRQVVAPVAATTSFLSGNALTTAAVLLVACSCAFALATPIAVIASVGVVARQRLLIEGGKYLEALARADTLLLDKTGTLTLGQPRITDVVSLNGLRQDELLTLAASAERYSEHSLAEAVRVAAKERGLSLAEPQDLETVPGLGVRAIIGGVPVAVGSPQLLPDCDSLPAAAELEGQGKTLLVVARNEEPVDILAARSGSTTAPISSPRTRSRSCARRKRRATWSSWWATE